MLGIFKSLKWYMKSDVELKYETCWYGKNEKIDGFKFYSKKPFSRSYQFHSKIGLENTYIILHLIQDAIKDHSRAIAIQIIGGWGRENIIIWKGSLKKAENQMFAMIKELQQQY